MSLACKRTWLSAVDARPVALVPTMASIVASRTVRTFAVCHSYATTRRCCDFRRSFLVPSCYSAAANTAAAYQSHANHYAKSARLVRPISLQLSRLAVGCFLKTAPAGLAGASSVFGPNSSCRYRLAWHSSCVASFVLIVRYSSSLRLPRTCSSRNFVSNSLGDSWSLAEPPRHLLSQRIAQCR